MKVFLFCFCCFFFVPWQLEAALAAPPIPTEMVADNAGSTTLERAEIEARLGRKLRFTERIALGILKRKIRRQQKRASNDGITDGLGVASFVVGLGSILLLSAGGLGFLTAIAGLVLGIVSLGRINRNPGFRTGKGFAIAGIAINGGLIFLAFLAFIIIFQAFN